MSAPVEVTRERYDAVLFDLDGVLTSTASLHARCWKQVFDEVLHEHAPDQPPFDEQEDYERYVDGKPREDGVRDFLAARGIHPPEGTHDDPADAFTIEGIGARKQALVEKELAKGGVEAYPGSVRWVKRLARGRPQDRRGVLERQRRRRAEGMRDPRPVRDRGRRQAWSRTRGSRASRRPTSSSKGAKRLDTPVERAVVVEDALAGVAAGRAGGFGLVIGVARTNEPEDLRAHGADVVVHDLGELAP